MFLRAVWNSFDEIERTFCVAIEKWRELGSTSILHIQIYSQLRGKPDKKISRAIKGAGKQIHKNLPTGKRKLSDYNRCHTVTLTKASKQQVEHKSKCTDLTLNKRE